MAGGHRLVLGGRDWLGSGLGSPPVQPMCGHVVSRDRFAALLLDTVTPACSHVQVLLLYELGLRAADFQRLTESRPEIFQMGIVTMRRKLKYFQDTIGLRCLVASAPEKVSGHSGGTAVGALCRGPW